MYTCVCVFVSFACVEKGQERFHELYTHWATRWACPSDVTGALSSMFSFSTIKSAHINSGAHEITLDRAGKCALWGTFNGNVRSLTPTHIKYWDTGAKGIAHSFFLNGHFSAFIFSTKETAWGKSHNSKIPQRLNDYHLNWESLDTMPNRIYS